ncbi:MAG: hypothetical protein ABTA24_10185 [Arthrobacter sp.]
MSPAGLGLGVVLARVWAQETGVRVTAVLVTGFLTAAWVLLLSGRGERGPDCGSGPRNPGHADRPYAGKQSGRRRPGRTSEDELHRLPLLVHQLAGLLTAGRTPAQLWADAARLSAGSQGEASRDPVSSTLERAARASTLGLSPVPVLQQAAQASSGLHAVFWEDLAACVQASERSGAPLAGILDRYALGLEALLDSRAARASALSGPRATVRLLTWLPLAGLGLGFMLDTNPLAVLAQSPVGWAAAAIGTALALIARIWSRRLISRAVPEEDARE